MANGNGNGDPLSGLPWWVKAIVIVGVPSAIALGLVWSNQTQLATKTYENNTYLRQIIAEEREHDGRVLLRFQQIAEQTGETNRILMANCVNNARTEDARDRCVGRR